MIERRTHQGRWTQTMPAAPCAVSLPARFRVWLKRQLNPRQPGRRAIDSAAPWGSWAAGWSTPANTNKKSAS